MDGEEVFVLEGTKATRSTGAEILQMRSTSCRDTDGPKVNFLQSSLNQSSSAFKSLFPHLQSGRLADAFIQSDLHKYISQKKETQQHIAVATERSFIEPSAKD